MQLEIKPEVNIHMLTKIPNVTKFRTELGMLLFYYPLQGCAAPQWLKKSAVYSKITFLHFASLDTETNYHQHILHCY
uniref:Uncharacterized protein n=1 Tax=Rhizophora mucronata TaxID=61149 RepID=A0A2P2P0T4_RHIMU